MKQNETYMTKTFGQSEISRQLFADMPHPICVRNLTDEQMEELAKNVERDVIQEFPGVAEKMFTLWSVGVEYLEPSAEVFHTTSQPPMPRLESWYIR